MKQISDFRKYVATLMVALLAATPAHGLITLNDNHDHIWVTGTWGVTHDSNVFASNGSPGDYIYTTSLVAEYQRRAGWIGVNASVSVAGSKFGHIKGQNFSNPTYNLELTKQTGRTTGSLTVNATRESRADAAVNLRTTSWNYAVGLNFKYPIVERYTLAGSFNYAAHKYADTSVFTNLATYAANFDLIYILPHERDLIGNYRYRYGETSRNSAYVDNAFSLGLGGKIFGGINGAVRAGYQIREPRGSAVSEGKFHGWTANASVSYPINRKTSLTGSVAKDYSTTATDTTVDSTTANIDAQYSHNARWSLTSNAGWGDTRFLGERGRVVLTLVPLLLGPNRHDNFVTWGANLNYTRSEHLKVSLGYTWFKNWSTTPFADFIRSSWTLTLSSRW
ncbi:MAG: hypothetical protein RLZZ15_3224 [Verrucomicrobiota bacterium]|jgi:hypothetical protein